MYDNKQTQSDVALGADSRSERPIDDEEIKSIFSDFAGAEPTALAVSGGADSMALLYLAARWRQLAPDLAPEFHVLTVDHGLRPEARAEAQRVAAAAASHDMSHAVLTWRARETTSRLQERARIARYDLMSDHCRKRGIGRLATAHHLDDQAETVLMRLARGSGVDGLAAIPKRSFWAGVEIARPLLDVSKSRLVATLRDAGQAWSEDPSNRSDAFERNRVRAALVQLEGLGFDAARLALTARRMRRAQKALETSTDKFLTNTLTLYEAGFCAMQMEQISAAPDEIALRALSRIVMAVGGQAAPPRLQRLENLLAALKGDEHKARTLGGCRIVDSRDRVCVIREYGRKGYPELTVMPGDSGLWDRRFKVFVDSDSTSPLTVRALGRIEFAALRRDDDVVRRCPSAIGSGLVSFWRGDVLVSVPHLNFDAERRSGARLASSARPARCGAQFVNAGLVAQTKLTAGLI
jgi:tRNA(Ile)-lysidine synthase